MPALYKGLGANMTRGAMVTAVEFSLFDKLKVRGDVRSILAKQE